MDQLQVCHNIIQLKLALRHKCTCNAFPSLLIADGADYTGGLYTATFSGSSTTSVRVPTLPDNVLEGLETFTGVIQVPPNTTTNYRVTAGSPDTATVNIMDATSEFSTCASGPSYIQFLCVYRECTFVCACPSMPANVSCSRCSATCYMRCVPSVLWLLALP